MTAGSFGAFFGLYVKICTWKSPISTFWRVSLMWRKRMLSGLLGVSVLGGPPCSAANPNELQLNLTLENDPGFETGGYNAQVTFVISSL